MFKFREESDLIYFKSDVLYREEYYDLCFILNINPDTLKELIKNYGQIHETYPFQKMYFRAFTHQRQEVVDFLNGMYVMNKLCKNT